jgi:hypothetical protein
MSLATIGLAVATPAIAAMMMGRRRLRKRLVNILKLKWGGEKLLEVEVVEDDSFRGVQRQRYLDEIYAGLT